jgi:hypothetical protein
MSQPDYDDIRQRITKRYENRTEFFGHLVGFLVINGLIWSGALGGWPVLNCISAAWFLGLAMHFVNFVMAEARERAIERAIQEARTWTSSEKPKRDPRVYLTEDGELEEITDDDDVEPPSQQRHR